MRPVLFHIPVPFLDTSIPLYSFETFHAIGWILVIFFAIRNAQRKGIDPNIIIHASFYGAIGFVTGARLFSVLQHLSFYLKNPADIFKVWQGGMVFYGGLIGGVIGVFIYLKAKKIETGGVFNCFSAPLWIGIFLGRIACFYQGCCFGKPTGLPWGVIYSRNSNVYYEELRQLQIPPLSESSLPVHPVQLYEAIEGILLFAFFSFILSKRKNSHGEIFYYFILSYAVLRFINEYFRGDEIRGFVWHPYLSVSQSISLLLIVLTFFLLLKNYKWTHNGTSEYLRDDIKRDIVVTRKSFVPEAIIVALLVLTLSVTTIKLISNQSFREDTNLTLAGFVGGGVKNSLIDISSDAIEGTPDAPVTIIEFLDFECPYCQRFYKNILKPLRNDYIKAGKVKFAYKHFPLDFHKNALKVGEALECARDQGKFFELHDKLFENFGEVSIKKIKLYANDIGIDPIRFNNCLDNGGKKEIILKDKKDGLKWGVAGTPTIFINGKRLTGLQNYNIIKNIIESELRVVTK